MLLQSNWLRNRQRPFRVFGFRSLTSFNKRFSDVCRNTSSGCFCNYHFTFNPSHTTGLFLYPPENIKKLETFWFFQGVRKEIIGMKWAKKEIKRKKYLRKIYSRYSTYEFENIQCTAKRPFNRLSANTTKWSSTFKQFVSKSRQIVWVCLTILWGWRLRMHWRFSTISKTSNRSVWSKIFDR